MKRSEEQISTQSSNCNDFDIIKVSNHKILASQRERIWRQDLASLVAQKKAKCP